MNHTHVNFSECEYPQILSILQGSNYFRDLASYSCKCNVKKFIYSREWDFEFREYFSRELKGILIGTKLIEDEIEKSDKLSPETKKDVKGLINDMNIIELKPSIDRISISINQEKIGFVDINSFGNICDAYLKPPSWMQSPHYFLTCQRSHIVETTLRYNKGETDEIECTPFIYVNPTIGVCAQYAVRMALKILSAKAPTVPEVVSEARKTTLSGGIERNSDDGWNAQEIRNFLEFNGYSVFHYNRNEPIKCKNCGNLVTNIQDSPSLENIYAYVESGVPVIIGVKNTKYLPWWDDGDERHALVAIGHTMDKNGNVDGLIIHDESTYPYQIFQEPLKEGKKFEDVICDAIAPVPREVVIDYQLAKELATAYCELEKDDTVRPILADSNQIKKWLGEGIQRKHLEVYAIPDPVKDDFLTAYMDRYVWLFEIRHNLSDGREEYTGDIIVSATQYDKPIIGLIDFKEGEYVYRGSEGEIVEKKF